MDDFLQIFLYPMMVACAEILMREIIRSKENELKKNQILAQDERWRRRYKILLLYLGEKLGNRTFGTTIIGVNTESISMI